MIRKFMLPLLAIIGVAIAVAMVIIGNRAAPAAQNVLQPANAPFTSYIFGPGIVEASTENIAIGTPVSGIVTAVYVKWGDRVKSGAPLFKVDTRDLQAQLLPANAKVKEVEAQLLPANAKVKEVEAQLLPANAKVNEAEATLAKVENRLKVGEGLEPGVSVSVEEMANRRFDVGTNKAIFASAEAQVEQIKTQIASTEAQVEQIETQIASAGAQVEQIKAQMELHTIRAPVSGRVLQMRTRLGEYAQTGVLTTPLMLLGDDTTLHVRVDIDENDAWRFQSCAPAVASVRGNPEIKTALQYVRTDPDVIPRVTLTGDTTQRTDSRVLQVIYSFDPASLALYIGQLMDVFIEAAPIRAAASGPQHRAGPCGDLASGNVNGRKP
jgi:multidrug resistance efflux pump